ncbi:hypothetical protein D3C80_1023870 [compost metagenome]
MRRGDTVGEDEHAVHFLAPPGCPVDIDHQAVIGHVAKQPATDRDAVVAQKNDAGMALLDARAGFEVRSKGRATFDVVPFSRIAQQSQGALDLVAACLCDRGSTAAVYPACAMTGEPHGIPDARHRCAGNGGHGRCAGIQAGFGVVVDVVEVMGLDCTECGREVDDVGHVRILRIQGGVEGMRSPLWIPQASVRPRSHLFVPESHHTDKVTQAGQCSAGRSAPARASVKIGTPLDHRCHERARSPPLQDCPG